MLRQPLLLLSRSEKVKDLVTTMPVSSGIVARYVPGETTEAAVDATRALVVARAAGRRSTSWGRTPSTVSTPTPRSRPTSRCSTSSRWWAWQATPRCRSSSPRWVRRCPTPVRRSRWRTPAPSAAPPATPARRSRSTWRTTPPPTRRWASCASCARTSRRPEPSCRPTSTGPRRTAGTSPPRARGCGCARARTRSRRPSPTRTASRSTGPTSAA